MRNFKESGRSMVEMLGVLAVIGILSVMGMAGFNIAMTKHKANTLFDETLKRAVSVSGQLLLGSEMPNLSGFNPKTEYGTFSSDIVRPDDKTFQLSVSEVQENVCDQTKSIATESKAVHHVDSVCASGELIFTFNNDFNSDTSSEGNEQQESGPSIPESCAAKNMYWCLETNSCVANRAACLASCPEERLCGETCCGEQNVCVDGNKCCYQDDDGNINDLMCCDANITNGFNQATNECCPEGKRLVMPSNDITANNFSGAGSGYATPQCCPLDSPGYAPSDGRCCEANEKLMGWWCCPSDTESFSLASGCCTADKPKSYVGDFLLCCESGQKPYCAQKDENGVCVYGGCCDGDVTEGVASNGADVCCSSGIKGYCAGYNPDGSCGYASCCYGTVIYDSGTILCASCYGSGTGYCSVRNSAGNCTATGCCPNGGEIISGLGHNGSDLCLGSDFEGCKTNEECGENEFCNLATPNSAAASCEYPSWGTCEPIGDYAEATITTLGLVRKSPKRMNFWGAENWCKAVGMNLIDVAKFGCYENGETLITEGSGGGRNIQCCAEGKQCDNWSGQADDYPPVVVEINEAFRNTPYFDYVWTASSETFRRSCLTYQIDFQAPRIYYNGERRNIDYALCSK